MIRFALGVLIGTGLTALVTTKEGKDLWNKTVEYVDKNIKKVFGEKTDEQHKDTTGEQVNQV